VRSALEPRPDVEVGLYDAGHAFNNDAAPMFHDPAAAAQAWERTVAFLDRHLRA
jgi:carboxymethylenebutenolidase